MTLPRFCPLITSVVAGFALSVTAPHAETFALVIGIDRYEHITPLRGAVNDAVDIASAISDTDPGALKVLIDGQATRERILATWQSYIDQAEPGDTIIVTFAGHGGSEPAAHPETERDGRDESLLLAGYKPEGPQAGERLRDDEIAAMIAQRSDIEHIIVADSCHSGTATRSAAGSLGYRFFDQDGIIADPLPPLSPPPRGEMAQAARTGGGNSIVFAAVGDDELVEEININGKVRGALSFAFADGLRGRADLNRDGSLTKGELETYVRRTVKTLLDGRQKPRIAPPGQLDDELFSLKTPPNPDDSAFSKQFAFLDEVPLAFVRPDLTSIYLSGFVGARPVDQAQQGGIVVDFEAREIRSGTGDMLRALTQEVGFNWRDQIQTTLNKMRAVNALQASGVLSDVEVTFPFGDALYLEDDRLRMQVTGRSSPHILLLLLAADGQIDWLYPRYPKIDRSGLYNDPEVLDPLDILSFDTRVTAPFGADHIIAIETTASQDALRRAANRFTGTKAVPEFWEELHLVLQDQTHSVGVHAVFTAAEK
ncbi:MAG: caspase family protein [Pseudomonadota bacterium]